MKSLQHRRHDSENDNVKGNGKDKAISQLSVGEQLYPQMWLGQLPGDGETSRISCQTILKHLIQTHDLSQVLYRLR